MTTLSDFSSHMFVLMSIGCIFCCEYLTHMLGYTNITVCYTNIINRSIKHNVLIVKIMQALTAHITIQHEIHKVLTENTHNVHYDEDELDQLLLNNICKQYKITLLDAKPVHSGMVSVVYMGKINDTKVVIKMKRKNIVSRINAGSNNVNFIYNVLDVISSRNAQFKSQLDSLKSITKTREYLVSQCDFANEIDALITTKREIAEYSVCDNIVIPEVYNTAEDISDTKFIIMEFLDGEFASSITDESENKAYYKIFAIFIIVNSWFCTYFHTDMHNGNIICMKDGDTHKIGVIDFGMNVKIITDIKKLLQLFGELAYTTGFENAKLHKQVNIMLEKPIDLSKMSDDQKHQVDKNIAIMASHMQSGDLTEQHINEGYNNMAIVLVPQFEFVFNIDFILLILGVSMGNSTIQIMVKNDYMFIEKTLKELYFEIME